MKDRDVVQKGSDDRNFMILPYDIELNLAQTGFRFIHQRVSIFQRNKIAALLV